MKPNRLKLLLSDIQELKAKKWSHPASRVSSKLKIITGSQFRQRNLIFRNEENKI